MIFNHGTWQGEWVRFIHRPLCSYVHITQKAEWIPQPLFTLSEKMILLFLLEKKLRFRGRPIRSVVTIPYDISYGHYTI
jgi:hypothetical protein